MPNQYTYFNICIVMSDVFASYKMPYDFIAFLEILTSIDGLFMSEVLYLHQIITACVSNHYNILIC